VQRNMGLHGGGFLRRDTDQMSTQPDHSSSIVPGGLEVIS